MAGAIRSTGRSSAAFILRPLPAEVEHVGTVGAKAGTEVPIAARRVAGQHARQTHRSLFVRASAALFLLLATIGVAIAITGLGWFAVAVEAAAISVMYLVEAKATPLLGRWRRGAEGEERVSQVLDTLRDRGWYALHDVQTGRGNIDHVVIGPGGLFTIETKSHRGRICVEKIDQRMLKQAYAESKAIETITGFRTQPLLVFSNAYLEPAVTQREGVLILPARMLAHQLEARDRGIPRERVAEVYQRLASALSVWARGKRVPNRVPNSAISTCAN
jgi:hypothetical protein